MLVQVRKTVPMAQITQQSKETNDVRNIHTQHKFWWVSAFVMVLVLMVGHHSWAVVLDEGDYPWSMSANHVLDKPVRDKYPNGSFLFNLGPTGLRARINPETPTQFLIKFVFQDDQSPARGIVNIGDVVVGANGKLFEVPYRFGRNGIKGWDGPPNDLARHIEDSQGADGNLSLIIWPGGDKAKQTNVVIPLKPIGRFSKTYPTDCPRSEKMLEELCQFMVSEYERDNNFGRIHVKTHSVLSLMASGISKHEPLIKQIVSGYAKNRYSFMDGGFTTWNWGFDGILMGEYYHRYKDKNLIPAIESLVDCYQHGQTSVGGENYAGGIYTHRTYPVITVAGDKPYASIAAISSLGMCAMSLFKSEGLKYNEEVYQDIHQNFLRTSKPEGATIAYAFDDLGPKLSDEISNRHAVITLDNPAEALSGKGPGFAVPTGMKKITKYKLFWPTKADPRWKPTEWVENERELNVVIELKDNMRVVFRNHPQGKLQLVPEPTAPYHTTVGSRHIMPTGIGAAAHLIGSKEKSWQWFGKHCANTAALTYDDAFSGHGGGQLHGFWMTVGAANADEDKQRKFLDHMKTFLVLSQTHNGGMIIQPWNRDRPGANSDVGYGSRELPSATAALMLSMHKKKLRIMGLGSSGISVDPKQMSTAVKGLYGEYTGERFGAAWKLLPRLEADEKLTALDKGVVSSVKEGISAEVDKALNKINVFDRTGDVVRLKAEITESSKALAGIDRFENEIKAIKKSLSDDPKRVAELKLGTEYDKLMAAVQKEGKTSKMLAALEKFASQNPESAYGKACAFLIAAHNANQFHKVQRDEYFIKRAAELDKK